MAVTAPKAVTGLDTNVLLRWLIDETIWPDDHPGQTCAVQHLVDGGDLRERLGAHPPSLPDAGPVALGDGPLAGSRRERWGRGGPSTHRDRRPLRARR